MAISPPSHPGYQWAVTSPCVFLKDLFDTAVASVHPAACLTRFLPPPPVGKLLVLAAGKAAGSMTEVAERHYIDALALPPARLDGIAVTRHGYGRERPRRPLAARPVGLRSSKPDTRCLMRPASRQRSECSHSPRAQPSTTSFLC